MRFRKWLCPARRKTLLYAVNDLDGNLPLTSASDPGDACREGGMIRGRASGQEKTMDEPTPSVTQALSTLADLIREHNGVARRSSDLICRPALLGHIGEFIASRVFDIQLESSAATPGIDGRFGSGPLADRTVNIKFYSQRDSMLDIATKSPPDVYLVLVGRLAPAFPSRYEPRPWSIREVFLLESQRLMPVLRARSVPIGVATSVPASEWEAARIYPDGRGPLGLDAWQIEALRLFAPDRVNGA